MLIFELWVYGNYNQFSGATRVLLTYTSKVQVVAGAIAGAAHRCDCLALGHGLTGRNTQGGAVRVESVDLIAVHNAMVDLDVVAPAVMITGFHDHAISGGIDRVP